MKPFLTIVLLLFMTIPAIGQKALKDSIGQKEAVAIAEFGGAASQDIKGGLSAGYSIAVEVTPIEDWLELELGVSPTFGDHTKETDIDFLFKKPWTFSQKAEFMFGLGLAWNHASDHNVISNGAAGEIALDFMFWPAAKHRFGWYLEPAYEYGFSREHTQSLGMSAGLLVSIP